MAIDSRTLCTLLMGFLGINITYIMSGILFEKIAKNSYHNNENNHYDLFRSSIGYCVVLRLITWLLSEVYCRLTLKKEQYVVIDPKNTIACGMVIVVSSISFMEALYMVSYPFIMMAKSSSVLQVMLGGVFYTRTNDSRKRLGNDKIVNSVIVMAGIVMFKLCDPETSFQSQISRHTEVLGLLLLLINLCADCFLPNFQAEIMYKFKPKPAQMLAEISRWSFVLCFVCSIFTGDLLYTIKFMMRHPTFGYEILALGVLSFLGQTFVYKMIQNFQQHTVPLIISLRKAFTVALSFVLFSHRTSFGQVVGIFITFSATIWECLQIIHKKGEMEKAKNKQSNYVEDQIQPLHEGNLALTSDEQNIKQHKINELKSASFYQNENQQEQLTLGFS